MLDFLLGLLLLGLVIGGALWTGRRSKPSGDGGSNVDAARRYGPGL